MLSSFHHELDVYRCSTLHLFIFIFSSFIFKLFFPNGILEASFPHSYNSVANSTTYHAFYYTRIKEISEARSFAPSLGDNHRDERGRRRERTGSLNFEKEFCTPFRSCGDRACRRETRTRAARRFEIRAAAETLFETKGSATGK